MEFLLAAIAVAGFVIMIAGRYIMIRDTGGDLPFLWIIALRLIPFSEMVYMVSNYAQAKKGGIISIIGMWLMVPWIGAQLWEEEQEVKQVIAGFEEQLKAQDDDADEEEMPREMLKEMPAEFASFYYRSQKARGEEKARKVEQMNARVKAWFEELQAKRAKLTEDPADLKRFNANVAAYSAYNALTKEANEELLAMQRPRQ